MAIITRGFSGTVDDIAWSVLAPTIGSYGEVDGDNLAVTVVSGADRTVQVATGDATAYGVNVSSNTPVTLQLPVIASGSRWDLIALRRDWNAKTATFEFVQGTSTAQLPISMEDAPGELHDQPLALVRVTAGQTLPTAVQDLRVYGSKVFTASSLLAVSQRVGTEVVVDGTRYRRESVGGNPTWVDASAAARPVAAEGSRSQDDTVARNVEAVVAQCSVRGAGRQVLIDGVVRFAQQVTTGNIDVRITMNGVTVADIGPFVKGVGEDFLSIHGVATASVNNPTVPIVLRAKTSAGELRVRPDSYVRAVSL